MVKSKLCIIGLYFMICFMIVPCFGQPKIYKYDDVKHLLREKAVSPSELFSSESNEDELCKCSANLPSLASRNDNETFTNPLIIAYTAPSISRCNSVKVYFAYRILMNQSEVNMAICKVGRKSRDMDDCDKSYDEPQLPPSKCPEDCIKEIKNIPKGDKGDKGDKGEKGSDGSFSNKTGVVGKAPPNNMTVQRSFIDLFAAFHNYTGCSIDQADSWWYEEKYPTLCRNYKQGGTLIKSVNPGTIIKTGFLIFWAFDPGYNHWPALAYRAKENDIIPVLCQVNSYPIFIARLESDYEDIVCPKEIGLDEEKSVFSILLLICGVVIGFVVFVNLVYLIVTRYFGVTGLLINNVDNDNDNNNNNVNNNNNNNNVGNNNNDEEYQNLLNDGNEDAHSVDLGSDTGPLNT